MIFDPLASSSHGNAYVVSDGHTSILLECGIPFRKLQKALGFRMGDIMACFVSHEHKDHAHSHLDLIKSGIPVYASNGTAEALDCDLIQTMEKTELEDLAYAVKVMAAEMIDNRQITAQYTGKNPMVMQILDLHSTNLLPSEG